MSLNYIYPSLLRVTRTANEKHVIYINKIIVALNKPG